MVRFSPPQKRRSVWSRPRSTPNRILSPPQTPEFSVPNCPRMPDPSLSSVLICFDELFRRFWCSLSSPLFSPDFVKFPSSGPSHSSFLSPRLSSTTLYFPPLVCTWLGILWLEVVPVSAKGQSLSFFVFFLQAFRLDPPPLVIRGDFPEFPCHKPTPHQLVVCVVLSTSRRL